jgi:hypothetical protein
VVDGGGGEGRKGKVSLYVFQRQSRGRRGRKEKLIFHRRSTIVVVVVAAAVRVGGRWMGQSVALTSEGKGREKKRGNFCLMATTGKNARLFKEALPFSRANTPAVASGAPLFVFSSPPPHN